MERITHEVIMLPTDKECNLWITWKQILGYNSTPTTLVGGQHLYILSDEEIKEGDFAYHEQMFNYIGFTGIAIAKEKLSNQDFRFESILDTSQYYLSTKSPKIIASTNPLLNLPQIHQSFISLYIEEYNAGRKIKKVEVEYEESNKRILIETGVINHLDSTKIPLYIPKINPDNTINIKMPTIKEDLEKKIEDAAQEYTRSLSNDFEISRRRKESFIRGAKSPEAKEYWQQGMYSKEHVQRLVDIITWYNTESDVRPGYFPEGIAMWEFYESHLKDHEWIS